MDESPVSEIRSQAMGTAITPRVQGFAGERLIVIPRPQLSAMSSDALTADLFPTDAGHFPSAQGHHVSRERGSPQTILLYCTIGRGWLRIAGKRFAIEPGVVALIPRGTPHEYGADTENPWTIYWMHVQGRRAIALSQRFHTRAGAPVRSIGADGELRRLFESLLSILSSPLSTDDLLAACGTTTHLMARAVTLRGVGRTSDGDDGVAHRLDEVAAYLRDRVRTRVTIQELAALTRLSRSHFIDRFRARFGRPPLDYFAHLKMGEAARLLASTALPVKQVGAAIGMDDPLYFSRAFRRVFGMPPSGYRVAAREQRREPGPDMSASAQTHA